MKKNNEEVEDLEAFKKALDQMNEEDFDGHTEFDKLSTKEKLIWLSELNHFKSVVKKSKV